MHTRSSRGAPALVGSACAALLAFAPLAGLAAETTDRAALEKELAEARAELDQAAREVAEISRQLFGGESGDLMRFVHGGPRGSMLGVNIGSGAARDDGVEVSGVSPGGPAEHAGIKTGDVLVALNGQALRRSGERTASQQLVEFMRGVEPGRSVKVEFVRDGKPRTAEVTTAPAEPPLVRVFRERMAGPMGEGMPMPGFDGMPGPHRAFRSLELVPVSPKLGAYFGTDHGLLVVRVAEGKGLLLEEGDVLQTIDGRTPDSPGHAFRILQSYQPGENVKLGVLRQRKQRVLDATIPAADAAPAPAAAPRLRQGPPPPSPPAKPATPGAGSA